MQLSKKRIEGLEFCILKFIQILQEIILIIIKLLKSILELKTLFEDETKN